MIKNKQHFKQTIQKYTKKSNYQINHLTKFNRNKIDKKHNNNNNKVNTINLKNQVINQLKSLHLLNKILKDKVQGKDQEFLIL